MASPSITPDFEDELDRAIAMERSLRGDTGTYPLSAGTKTPIGPSAEAAERMTLRLRPLQFAVLEELKQGSGTADELAIRLGFSPFTTRPRCTELKRLGVIRETGERRKNESGFNASVWCVRDDAPSIVPKQHKEEGA